jgi:S1-C subfamily serine protease
MAHEHLLTALSSEITSLVERASASVVGVAARPHRPASGIALGSDLVLTADHAVERDSGIVVRVGDARYDATLVARDAATDLALLRVAGLSAAEPAGAEPPAPGALVVSLARTSAGTVSAALGVITSVGGPLRTSRGVVLPRVIRTDAALRPGTAGGAIVDTQGRVLGMTTPALLRGLPVAIPIAQARAIAERLASGGAVGRGYLGVSVHAVRLPERQRAGGSDRGLLVSGIAADSAADRAGLLVGDVLVTAGKSPLQSVDDLQDAIAEAAPGTVVPVALLRGAGAMTTDVTLGARPTP